MGGERASDAAGRRQEAESLYVRKRAADGEGSVDIERLCAERPDLREDLLVVHSRWLWLAERLGEAGGAFQDQLDPALVARLESMESRRRYSLLEELARGGMGTVHRAWDARLKCHVAMKISRVSRAETDGRAGSTSSRVLHRFLDEAQVMAQLHHPAIVPVYDVGLDEQERPFFTMRLVEGVDLDTAVRLMHGGAREWTLERLVEGLVTVCEALAYAHSKGVLHRDLKPSNVMVGRFGQVYVMDWGLARVIGREDPHAEEILSASAHGIGGTEDVAEIRRSHAGLTADGDVVGTAFYMPPEQARGELDAISQRSDVYAAGALLYQVLTGRRPYAEYAEGGARSVLEALLLGPPRPVHAIAPGAPEELAAVCEKAMAREPEDRYPDADELAADLRAYLGNRVVRAHRTGPGVELRKWIERNRVEAWIGFVGLVLILASLSTAIVVQSRRGAELRGRNEALALASRRAEQGEERARREARAAERSRRMADRAAYGAILAAARSAARGNRIDFAEQILASAPQELRGWEWDHVASHLDASEFTWPASGASGAAFTICFSDSGDLAAVGFSSGQVDVRRAETGELVASIAGHSRRVVDVEFHPAGGTLVTASQDGFVRAWGSDPWGRPLAECRHGAPVGSARLDVAGERVVTACRDGRVRMLRFPSLEIEWSARLPSDMAWTASFSPTGDEVVCTSDDNVLRVLDAASGQVLREVQALPAGDWWFHRWAALFTRDGTRIVHGSHDGRVWVRDVATLEVLREFTGHESRVWGLALSPDGRYVASASWDRTVRRFDLVTGAARWVGVGHAASAIDLAFDARGRLHSTDFKGAVKRWSDVGAGLHQSLADALQAANSAPFEAGGTRFLLAGNFSRPLVYDLETGEILRSLWTGIPFRHSYMAKTADWSPRGDLVAVGFSDGGLRVWDPESGEMVGLLLGTGRDVDAARFGPRGERLYGASRSGDVLAFSTADFTRLAAAEQPSGVLALNVRPETGEVFTGGRDGVLVVRDPLTLEERSRIEAHAGAIHEIAVDASGDRLATAGQDAIVRVWSCEGLSLLFELRGHSDAVHSVAFSPDGTRLVSGGRDSSVKVWELEQGTEVLSMAGHAGWIWDVRLSPDGETIVSVSGDKTVRLWDRGAHAFRGTPPGFAEVRGDPRVEALFGELGLIEEVEAALERDETLDAPERTLLVRAARLRGEDPGELDRLAERAPPERAARLRARARALRPPAPLLSGRR